MFNHYPIGLTIPPHNIGLGIKRQLFCVTSCNLLVPIEHQLPH